MAEKNFTLQIITPRRTVFNGDVTSFSAPGVEGGFEVLFNHAPLLAAIGVGEIRCTPAGGTELRFATSGGVVDVLENKAVVLAETAEPAGEIDAARAAAAKERASRELASHPPAEDVEEARRALDRAVNRIKTAAKG
jgi:F-type H+-transporting ATPase subunit epsilon